jgi:predicted HicB family RNase H-like nuclease
VNDTEAQALLEKHANHLVEQYFGEMPEGGAAERRLTIRIPGNLADRLESLAKAQSMSLNTYAMRCFERCAAADGQPAVQG